MHHQALSVQYFEHAYELYMSGEVDFAVPLQAVEDRYGRSVPQKVVTETLTCSTLAVKNEQLQSLLDEESEALARQNAEYEQLRSSAVSLTPSGRVGSDDSTAPARDGTKTE